MRNLLAVMVLGILVLAIAIGSVQGATDYQNGTAQGLWTGLKMGQLLGLAQSGNLTAAGEYNALTDRYNDGLIKIFGQDQVTLATFTLPKINSSYIKELKAKGYSGDEISKLLC